MIEETEMQKKPEYIFMAPFSYLFGFFSATIISFIVEEDDIFTRFNVMQSAILSGFASIVYGVCSLIKNIFTVLSRGSANFIVYAKINFAVDVIIYIFLAAMAVIFLYLLYSSFRGRTVKVKFFGKISEKTTRWKGNYASLLCGAILILCSLFGFLCYYIDLKVKGLI
jgi:uncharacterized membrane protein